MSVPKIAPSELLLRLSLTLALLYPPIDAFSDPYSWIGYIPSFITDFVAPHGILLLHAFGVVELALALWVLFGRRIWIPSLVSAVLLVVVVAANPTQFSVLFYDLSIALSALALALINRRHERQLSLAKSQP